MRFLKLKIHTQILIAMILGVAFGAVFGDVACKLKIVGDIFISLLKMIMLPLIVASMVCGVASIGNVRRLGRMGLKTFFMEKKDIYATSKKRSKNRYCEKIF